MADIRRGLGSLYRLRQSNDDTNHERWMKLSDAMDVLAKLSREETDLLIRSIEETSALIRKNSPAIRTGG